MTLHQAFNLLFFIPVFFIGLLLFLEFFEQIKEYIKKRKF